MNEIKRMIRKMKFKATFVLFIGCIFVILSVIYPDDIFTKIIIATIVFILLSKYLISMTRKIDRILYFEMDPYKYYEVKSAFSSDRRMHYTAEVDYFVGNYAAAIDSIESLKSECQTKIIVHHNKLMLLCNAYFECGNYEALAANINYIKNAFAKYENSKGIYPLIYKPQLEFFESYMQGNYEECKKIKDLLDLRMKNVISNTLYAKLLCYYAMTLEKCGEKEKANGIFEEIIRFCPMFNYSNIARFYLNGNKCFE